MSDDLRKALETIAAGDEPRPIGKAWRNDGKPSKNDKCIHDCWMYEACGQCVAEFAAQALASTPASSPPLITEEMVERAKNRLAAWIITQLHVAYSDGEYEDMARACLTAALASPKEGGKG